MSEWEPEVDFESELLSIHPECDITPENYCDPPKSLAGKYLKSLGVIKNEEIQNGKIPNLPDLGAQMKMANHVAANKPIGQRIVPINDSETENDSFVRSDETVIMLRKAGMGPHVEGIDIKRTIATVEIKEDYTVCPRTGRTILWHEKYFKFRAHKNSGTSENSSCSTSTSSVSRDSEGSNITHTILNNSTTSNEDDTDKHSTPFNSQFNTIQFYAPRELYEMKRAKPRSKILNTKKMKKKLQPPQ